MGQKVVAVMGSPRKGNTYDVVQRFEQELLNQGDIDFEYIHLKDVDLKTCKGCGLCLERGEEFCPLKDDRDQVVASIMNAEGVIFASPVYSLQVTALMKNMLDRLAYIFHRPCCFHKVFMPIVVQGVYGQDSVMKYLNEVARFWGFNILPGLGATIAVESLLPEDQEKLNKVIEESARSFYRALSEPQDMVPSLKEVIMFHVVRSVHAQAAGLPRDHEYFRDQGWFTADYYYPVKLGLLKRLISRWADKIGRKEADKALLTKRKRAELPTAADPVT